jgi:hypothetical protein
MANSYYYYYYYYNGQLDFKNMLILKKLGGEGLTTPDSLMVNSIPQTHAQIIWSAPLV